MRSVLPSHLWIARYCKRALQLVPELSTPAAVRRAVAAFPYASGMQPEGAAELYAKLSEMREGSKASQPIARVGPTTIGRER